MKKTDNYAKSGNKWYLRYPGGSSWNSDSASADGPGPAGLELAGPEESILFDCGVEFSGRPGRGPNLDIISRKLSAMVATHSHYDHIGGLPDLAERELLKEKCPIFCTPQTSRILPLALDDMFQQGDADYFTIADILSRRHIISQPGITEIIHRVTMRNDSAGHIPGAMTSAVKLPSGHVGLVAGDVGWHDQPVVGGSSIPDDLPDEYLPDSIWWLDLTNPQLGSMKWEAEKKRMTSTVIAELEQGKICASFTFGNSRGQNVLLELLEAGVKPIYIAGVIPDILRIYMQERWCPQDRKIDPLPGVRVIKNRSHFEELVSRGGPLCLITTSGMGDYGYAASCLAEGLADPSWFIAANSWVHPASAMGRVLRHKDEPDAFVKLEDSDTGEKMELPIRARVDQFHLSAHGTLGDWVTFLRKLTARRKKAFGKKKELLDMIVLTHGTQQAKRLAESVLRPFAKKIIFGNMNTVIEIPS